jgi:photosystem II stability/assembly factor-like uncharacterized protein
MGPQGAITATDEHGDEWNSEDAENSFIAKTISAEKDGAFGRC